MLESPWILPERCDSRTSIAGSPIQMPGRLISRTSTVRARFANAGVLSSPRHALSEHMCLECQSDVSRVPERPMQLPERCGSKAYIARAPFETAGAHCLHNVYCQSALCYCRSVVSSVPERPMQLPERYGSRHELSECF
ncbi:hypothetical protein AMTR_s00029p00215010 [Amborella trichopoda]|uniref:Uncharacterized protein n=1 Tax=Amborella trichopoda TaxID=13333 RepID=W1PR46_AMBTC|nr:hypothetical protein AMTR_s00029p00215010 [Amborella trichopoda]